MDVRFFRLVKFDANAIVDKDGEPIKLVAAVDAVPAENIAIAAAILTTDIAEWE